MYVCMYVCTLKWFFKTKFLTSISTCYSCKFLWTLNLNMLLINSFNILLLEYFVTITSLSRSVIVLSLLGRQMFEVTLQQSLFALAQFSSLIWTLFALVHCIFYLLFCNFKKPLSYRCIAALLIKFLFWIACASLSFAFSYTVPLSFCYSDFISSISVSNKFSLVCYTLVKILTGSLRIFIDL